MIEKKNNIERFWIDWKKIIENGTDLAKKLFFIKMMHPIIKGYKDERIEVQIAWTSLYSPDSRSKIACFLI